MSGPSKAEVEEFVTRMWGERLQPWQVKVVVDYILTNDPGVLPDDPQAGRFCFLAAVRFDTEHEVAVGKKKDEDKLREALKKEAERSDNRDSKNYSDEEALAEILRRAGKKGK